jgi:two-component system alkaline phosphatase synthesis response regulator PhoP
MGLSRSTRPDRRCTTLPAVQFAESRRSCYGVGGCTPGPAQPPQWAWMPIGQRPTPDEMHRMNALILIVEDEKRIATQARDYLERGGFQVRIAADGRTALAIARHERPDLVVLDLNLPEMDGLDVCRALRRESDVPIIMLTARVEEADRLIGLELGADDYITKPFSPRELVARVRAVLRRIRGGVYQPGLIRVGELEIDTRARRVTRAGQAIHLTRTEFDLLATLAQHTGQAFTRAQLLDRLHGVHYDGYDRSVDAHIKNLRRKLEPDPAAPRYVLTVYGVGYRFTDEV